MPAVTGLEIVSGAFALLNVFAPGESIPANDGEYVRTAMNDLLSEWSNRTQMIPVIARERFDLVANQGGEDHPYTIGEGADFDTDRPPNQASITAANLILTATSPEVRVPLGIYTDQAYDANQIPGMTSQQPTGLYYSPTYVTSDWGSIYLWPVPNTSENDLELFLEKAVASFADLSTTHYVPSGLPRVLKYNVAQTIAGAYGRQLSAADQLIARSSLGVFTRSNLKMSDLRSDANFGAIRRGLYNIQTGNG